MTDQELKDLVASLAISQAKTDEQMKKTDEQMKKTDKQMKTTDEQMKELRKSIQKVNKMVGNIGNNQGDVAEEFFFNSLEAKPILGGITYDLIDKNVTRSKKGFRDEYDILMVNGKDVAIIETKYKAHENDVIKLIQKKYENFKKLYTEYKDYNHHLGLASFYVSDSVKNEALKNNIMVLQRKGDIIETTLP